MRLGNKSTKTRNNEAKFKNRSTFLNQIISKVLIILGKIRKVIMKAMRPVCG